MRGIREGEKEHTSSGEVVEVVFSFLSNSRSLIVV